MTGFLLDTNIPSETLRLVPEIKVASWLRTQSQEDQFISVITLGELRRGATLLSPGARRTEFERFIDTTVQIWFGPRILPITRAIADRWGLLDAERQIAGKPLNIADGLIAATAVEHDLGVVTRNVRDFMARAS